MGLKHKQSYNQTCCKQASRLVVRFMIVMDEAEAKNHMTWSERWLLFSLLEHLAKQEQCVSQGLKTGLKKSSTYSLHAPWHYLDCFPSWDRAHALSLSDTQTDTPVTYAHRHVSSLSLPLFHSLTFDFSASHLFSGVGSHSLSPAAAPQTSKPV